MKASDVDLKLSNDKYCYHIVNTNSCFNVLINVMRSEAASSAVMEEWEHRLEITSYPVDQKK